MKFNILIVFSLILIGCEKEKLIINCQKYDGVYVCEIESGARFKLISYIEKIKYVNANVEYKIIESADPFVNDKMLLRTFDSNLVDSVKNFIAKENDD